MSVSILTDKYVYYDLFIALFKIIWYNKKNKENCYKENEKYDLPLFKSRHKQIIELWLSV